MDRQSNRFSWHPGIVGPDQEVSSFPSGQVGITP